VLENISRTAPILLANRTLLPLASDESAAIPVSVSVSTVVVTSGIASFRTAAFLDHQRWQQRRSFQLAQNSAQPLERRRIRSDDVRIDRFGLVMEPHCVAARSSA
jgi:hypothetical protein